MHQVEDVDLGGNAHVQRRGHCSQHCLFVMMEDEREDLDHFPVTAGMTQQMPLQALERLGQVKERRPVAQRPGLALHDGQVMVPVIDCAAGAIMGPLDDALVLAYDLSLGDDQEAIGIDPQADRPVGE